MFEAERKFIQLAHVAQQIYDSDSTWEIKYDLIFSDNISKAIYQARPTFDYYDPDTSYEEDVRAFCNAASEEANQLTIALKEVP